MRTQYRPQMLTSYSMLNANHLLIKKIALSPDRTSFMILKITPFAFHYPFER